MKTNKSAAYTTLGLVFLIFSIILFKDTLKWVGFGVSLLFLLIGLSGRILKNKGSS